MKVARFLFGLILLAAVVASAASSYKVTLQSDLFAGDVQLKAGEYTMTLEGKQVVFKKGKESFQIPFSIEKNEKKFKATTLEIDGSKIHSIDLEGTDMKIMFRSSH
jgi:hypothetical protein